MSKKQEKNVSTKIASSPERHTFQKNAYLKRCAEEGKAPNPEYVAMYEEWQEEDQKWAEQTHENDLEYDLRSTDWMVEKVRASESYAQNLYAAMCNNDFQRLKVWPVLKDETWSCSWRSAGGIVANMRGEGDYIDWYCSGIRDIGVYAPVKEDETLTEEQQARLEIVNKFVAESVVTDEIRADLLRLGWAVVTDPDEAY